MPNLGIQLYQIRSIADDKNLLVMSQVERSQKGEIFTPQMIQTIIE